MMRDDIGRQEPTPRGQDPTIMGNEEPRLRQLSRLGDYEVAEGDPDIRGWRVFDGEGNAVGDVHDLIADVNALRVRYLDVELDAPDRPREERRHVLVPIGAARLSVDVNAITLSEIRGSQLASYPEYDHADVSREYERRVRAVMSGAPLADEGSAEEFYRHEHFDTSRLRPPPSAPREPTPYSVRVRSSPGPEATPPDSSRR
jgi:photosynthetic reaction center H subunit